MAYPGQRIESPEIGQAITFLETSGSSRGRMLTIEAEMQPGARIPAHVHTGQEERFEVVAGCATFWLGRERTERSEGEVLTISPGSSHRFRNESGVPVRIRAELRPALDAESLFEALFALAGAGRTRGRSGAPGPLQTAVLVREFPEEFFYPAGVPPAVVRVLAAPLAAAGRALGRPARAEVVR